MNWLISRIFKREDSWLNCEIYFLFSKLKKSIYKTDQSNPELEDQLEGKNDIERVSVNFT